MEANKLELEALMAQLESIVDENPVDDVAEDA